MDIAQTSDVMDHMGIGLRMAIPLKDLFKFAEENPGRLRDGPVRRIIHEVNQHIVPEGDSSDESDLDEGSDINFSDNSDDSFPNY